MKIRAKNTFFFILFLCFLMEAFSRTEQTPTMQKAPVNVKVDGKLTEWGDTLAMYDSKSKINYTIANNDTDLYVAIFAADKQTKHKIMAGGITISVNGEGKKKKTFGLSYPLPNKAAVMNRNHEEDAEEIKPPSLIESTSIRVTGFKDVESDVITTANTYGFKAAINFDDKHNLVCETAIPLKMLSLKTNKKKPAELAINICINGIERPSGTEGGTRRGGGGMEGGGIGGGGGMGMGGGMSGTGGSGRRSGGGMGGNRGGNRGSASQNPDNPGISQATDFWINLALYIHQ